MVTTFGAWVRQRRRALDLTQAELAAQICYSAITVRRVESGERRPSPDLIGALGTALAIPQDELGAFHELGRTLVGDEVTGATQGRPTAVWRLHPPPPPLPMIARQRITDRLDEVWSMPLTTIIGATGFGKTVAAGSWAEGSGAAWLRVSSTDAELGAFSRAVLDAIRLAAPALDPARLGPVDGLVGPDTDDTVRAEAVAARIMTTLESATGRRIALVLDEVEVLGDESPGLDLLESLVRLAHPALHLVVISRTPLAFSIDRLRARGQLLELGPDTLRFTTSEVAQLLTARLGPDGASLAPDIHGATEGWAAAVRLASETLIDTPPEQRHSVVAQLGQRPAAVFGALAVDLLAGLPDPARQMVRIASTLPAIDVELCQRLELADAPETIELLAARGALRAADSTWVLSEVVRSCVEASDPLRPDEQKAAARVCAEWLTERGEANAALDLLCRIGDIAGGARLLDEHAGVLVTQGHAVQVARMADLLPPDLRTTRAETAIGQALVIVGRWEEALASMRLASGTGAVSPALAYWTGMIHHLRGDLEGALDAYGGWQPHPDDDPAAASLVHSMRSTTLWLLGRATQARRDADEGLRLAHACGDPTALSGAHTALAMIATGDGDRRANDVHDRLALEFAEAAGNALQVVRIRSNRGSHLVETADYELALEELDVALELADLTGFATFGALARSNRAEALAALGRHEEASTEFLAAAEVYDRLGSRLVIFPLGGLADLHLARGELGPARAGYERVIQIANDVGATTARSTAQAGLARALAGSDPARARDLAAEVRGGAGGMAAVPARLGAAWVLLHLGELAQAAELAVEIADLSMTRRDASGYAEACELAALTSRDAGEQARRAAEAVAEWERIGDRFRAERARYALAAVLGDGGAAQLSWAVLRRLGMRDAVTGAAGPVAAAHALTSPTEPATHAHVCLLGEFRVLVGDRAVTRWPDATSARLLRLLATHRWRSTTSLIQSLFAGRQPPDAEDDLATAVAELRWLLDPGGALPEDHFITTLPGRVELTAHVEVDAERFLSDAAALADRCDHEHDAEPCDDIVEALTTLESRFTGELLEGEPVSGEPGSLREECRAAYLSVLRQLIQAHLARDSTDEALRYGLRLLREDPYDEPTHLALVELLAGERRHGEAMRHYRRYTARMRELGLEPVRYPGPR